MLKQWKNDNLGVIYFYVPNSKKNEILTTDGVLLPYDEFKSMSSEEYSAKKNTSGLYDYQLSRQSERLVKKSVEPTSSDSHAFPMGVNKSTNDFVKSSNTLINNFAPKVEQPKALPQKKIKVPKEVTEITKSESGKIIKNTESNNNETHKIIKSSENEIKSEMKPMETVITYKEDDNSMYNKNLFDIVYPKLMLILAVICSALSIYFTGTYLQRLQSPIIAYAISSAMLFYGLVGSQMTRRAWKSKHFMSAVIFGITATCTIGFSMLSSIDVNYAKYKDRHSVIEETYNVNDGKKLSFDLLKEELADNKKQIEKLNSDIEFQQTQWVLSWDSELGKNVLLEGRISATAQQKITDDNVRIEELNNRNKEINQELREYAESGVSVEKVETKTDRAKSLTDLVGAMINVSGNVIQLIFLLIPSFFIDIINVLALGIYVDKFEKKEEKD